MAGTPVYHNCSMRRDDSSGAPKSFFPWMLQYHQAYMIAVAVERQCEGLLDHGNANKLEMKWTLVLRAMSIYVVKSRAIVVGYGFLRFLFTVLLVMGMVSKTVITVCVAMMYPLAVAASIPFVIFYCHYVQNTG